MHRARADAPAGWDWAGLYKKTPDRPTPVWQPPARIPHIVQTSQDTGIFVFCQIWPGCGARLWMIPLMQVKYGINMELREPALTLRFSLATEVILYSKPE